MFTGIVSAIGEVVGLARRAELLALSVRSGFEAAGVAIGASIAHQGVCLTIVEAGPGPGGQGLIHTVELAAETLAKTTLGGLALGDPLNLERALRVGDELGGHWVSGHVDGIGRVLEIRPVGEGWRVRIEAPQALAPLIAPKGSIAVDGVSLTVNEVEGARFETLLIPHTWRVTTLHRLAPGAGVNLEADLMARYAARWIGGRP